MDLKDRSYFGNITVEGEVVADNFNGLNFKSMTQAAYDALGTKDANTIYFLT